MLQTVIPQQKFKYYLMLARATLKQYEQAEDAVLHEIYLQDRYNKGDRYGWFNLRTRKEDQTYHQFVEQQLSSEWSLFKMYYRDGVFEWQVEKLEKLSDDFATAINHGLDSIVIDVADVRVMQSPPVHYLLKQNDTPSN